jgi:nucleotide-binding universal stress UspA family protein
MDAGPILVMLTAPDAVATTLAAASDAARALGNPPIEVLHVRLDPVSTIMPSEEILTPERVRAVEASSVVEGTAVYAGFTSWQAAGHSGQWIEVIGDPPDELRKRSAKAGLIVLTQPAAHGAPLGWETLEAAVFGTGHPVLVVPPGWQGGFGRHLAVGWHDTPPTRQALMSLRPWLDAAETITALTVTDDDVSPHKPPLTDGPLAGLAARLEQRVVASTSSGDGADLLAAAVAAGADGLAMGAYRRGRMIEWVLGGATEYALHHATLPLLLMH